MKTGTSVPQIFDKSHAGLVDPMWYAQPLTSVRGLSTEVNMRCVILVHAVIPLYPSFCKI